MACVGVDILTPSAHPAPMVQTLLFVAAGGALGAGLRYLVGLTVTFPFGTLTVNAVGSFAIGFVWVWMVDKVPGAVPFLMVGVLGGFTTFSTFSLDVVRLVEDGRLAFAFGYVAATLVLAIGGCVVAVILARSLAA